MDDLESLERAIAALEQQRDVLGADVVATALQPLRQRRAALAAEASGGQRKLVTVLFADLVDFTVLSQRLDAEDTRAVVNAYFRRWHDCITAYGGVVEKFIGDAVMAVFGLHQAHEEDPHNAIRAALAMTSALPALNEEIATAYGVQLAMRIGIDTGDVVVSALEERPGQEFVAVGETVNRASRIQGAAPAGEIMISADTYQHVRGRFSLQPTQPLQLKGVAEPVAGYLVRGERPREFRLDPARGVEGVETQTVGRAAELVQLQERYLDVAEERRRQVVTVVGDAGVGKTRLLLELDRWLAEQPESAWWFRGRASHSGRDVPGALLRDLVTTRFGIAVVDPPDVVWHKFRNGFEQALGAGPGTAHQARLVAAWLGLEAAGPESAEAAAHLPTDPHTLRELASTAFAEYFVALADRAPVVVLLEDLHWADDVSLAAIDVVQEALGRTPMLVVATARPALYERRPHWGEGLDFHVRLDLEPLSRRESRTLLAELLKRADDVPASLIDTVVTAAEGNPFYIEELVQWLLDAGVIVRNGETWVIHEDRLEIAEVPPTLRGVLQARLDALSAGERAILQRAAVIGRVFWDDAVHHLGAAQPETAVPAAEALGGLRQREVVFERERSAFGATREFVFKHALLRDVSYDGVLKAQRRRYHQLVGKWLEQVSERTRRGDEYAALVADHYRLADDPAASDWYLRAGRRAAGVHAIDEALRLLGHGLDTTPADELARAFDLRAVREQVLDRMGDRAAQEAELVAMGDLADRLGDSARSVALLLARARQAFQLSRYDEATAAAQAAGAMASEAGLPASEMQARLLLGKTLTWQMRHDEARRVLGDVLAKARALRDAQAVAETLRYRSMVSINAGDYADALDELLQAQDAHPADQDPDGAGRILAQFASIHYNLGRYDEARSYLEQSVPVFHASGHRYLEVVALGNLASVAVAQGHLGAARRHAREAYEMCRRLGDQEAVAINANVLASVALAVGEWPVATAHAAAALAIGEAVEVRALMADSLTRLALAAVGAGDVAGAIGLADRAVANADSSEAGPIEQSHARLGRAYARLAADDHRAADADFALASEHFSGLGLEALVRECRAGQAAAALGRGDHQRAVALVDPVLPFVDGPGLEAVVRPGKLLLTCHDVLLAMRDPRADDLLSRATGYLHERAARIDDAGMRLGFLALADHAELLARGAGSSDESR